MTIELLKDHVHNERRFPPGTILNLPEGSARSLIEAGGARLPVPQPQPTDESSPQPEPE